MMIIRYVIIAEVKKDWVHADTLDICERKDEKFSLWGCGVSYPKNEKWVISYKSVPYQAVPAATEPHINEKYYA